MAPLAPALVRASARISDVRHQLALCLRLSSSRALNEVRDSALGRGAGLELGPGISIAEGAGLVALSPPLVLVNPAVVLNLGSRRDFAAAVVDLGGGPRGDG